MNDNAPQEIERFPFLTAGQDLTEEERENINQDFLRKYVDDILKGIYNKGGNSLDVMHLLEGITSTILGWAIGVGMNPEGVNIFFQNVSSNVKNINEMRALMENNTKGRA